MDRQLSLRRSSQQFSVGKKGPIIEGAAAGANISRAPISTFFSQFLHSNINFQKACYMTSPKTWTDILVLKRLFNSLRWAKSVQS